MNKSMVSIIIPTKDEPNLPALLNELSYHLFLLKHEIIIVTGDKNKKELSLSKSLTTTTNPINIKLFKSYGDSLERAILLGFSVSQGDKIIVMDADGSHTPETVPTIIEELNEYEMVIGSRFVNGSIFKTTLFRRLVTWLFSNYARLLGSTLSDPMSGFFGIRKELLKNIKFKPFKWKTCLEISNKLRPKTKEIPLNFKAFTNKGRGKFHNWKIGIEILYDIMVEAL